MTIQQMNSPPNVLMLSCTFVVVVVVVDRGCGCLCGIVLKLADDEMLLHR